MRSPTSVRLDDAVGALKPRQRKPAISVGQIELRDPKSLLNNPRNARTHSRRQKRQLMNSISTSGFIGAIIVDENDTILAGRARNDVGIELGMELVPTLRVTGLTEAKKRAFVLADNKIASNAGWDLALLKIELSELVELLPLANLDLSITGFEAAEVDSLLIDGDDTGPEPTDDLPDVHQKSVTRKGDLWLCGPHHHLLCGDSSRRLEPRHCSSNQEAPGRMATASHLMESSAMSS